MLRRGRRNWRGERGRREEREDFREESSGKDGYYMVKWDVCLSVCVCVCLRGVEEREAEKRI